MKYKKRSLKVISVIVLNILLFMQINTFAYDVEEGTDYIWLEEELENVSKDVDNEPKLNSRYAVVLDRNSKTILFSKNSDKRVPMASTTKIMTAIVLLENLKVNNNLTLNTKIEVCKEAAAIGGSRLGLKIGDKITLNDLLYGLMLCSGNDAAIQIAVSIGGSVEEFANLMNRKAQELGLKDTHFITPHGLDEDEHYTTAYELALIADYALNIEKFSEVVRTKNYTVNIDGRSKNITNTNELLGYLSGVNGVKTGFTNGAGRCLVTSVSRNGFDIITVVLGADTKKIRTKDSINLIEYTYSNYQIAEIRELIEEKFKQWRLINEKRIKVYKGKKNNVITKLGDYKYKKYPIKRSDIEKINIEIKGVNQILEAPVNAGTKIGELILSVDGEKIINIDILTSGYVQRKGIKEYLVECIDKMI